MSEPTPVRRHHWENRNKPHMVYELYDRHGHALYVGCTIEIVQRLAAHRKKPWWHDVAEIHTETHPTGDIAGAVEAARIAELQPAFNHMHTEKATEAARERWVRRKAARAES